MAIQKEKRVNSDFSKPAADNVIEHTMLSLCKNGIDALAFDSKEELRKKLFCSATYDILICSGTKIFYKKLTLRR